MPALNEIRFLVVDDMPAMRKLVAKQLREAGAVHLTEADDGATAWDALTKAAALNLPIQFVVSDWNMPKMKGIDLLKKCREDTTYKNVAFLLVTAEAEVPQVTEAVKLGVDNYVVKPFNKVSFETKMMAVYKKRFPPGK